jgi:hypothetical protein
MTPDEEKRISDRFERIESDLETIAGYVLKHEHWFEEQRGLFSELTRKMSDLADAQKRTDDRLNVVIGMVERYFSNGQR